MSNNLRLEFYDDKFLNKSELIFAYQKNNFRIIEKSLSFEINTNRKLFLKIFFNLKIKFSLIEFCFVEI